MAGQSTLSTSTLTYPAGITCACACASCDALENQNQNQNQNQNPTVLNCNTLRHDLNLAPFGQISITNKSL